MFLTSLNPWIENSFHLSQKPRTRSDASIFPPLSPKSHQHQFLSLYLLNISHLYTALQASGLSPAQAQSLLTHLLASRLLPPILSHTAGRGISWNPNLIMSLPLRGFCCIWKDLACSWGPLILVLILLLQPSCKFLLSSWLSHEVSWSSISACCLHWRGG